MSESKAGVEGQVEAGLSRPPPLPPSLPRVGHGRFDELQVDVTQLVQPEVVEDLQEGGGEGGREGGREEREEMRAMGSDEGGGEGRRARGREGGRERRRACIPG